jgi:hypothetical protein
LFLAFYFVVARRMIKIPLLFKIVSVGNIYLRVNPKFESRQGHGCQSLLFAACCEAEVSATGPIVLPDESYWA